MRRHILYLLLLSAAFLLASCGRSTSKFAPQPLPNIAGAWEMIAAPATNNGTTTGIEVALKEGQVLNTTGSGSYEPDGQISASGTQISFVGLNAAGVNATNLVFGGNCAVAGSDTSGNNLTGSVSGVGGSFNFTYNENGNDFSVTATVSSDGKSMMGTYTSQSGSNCSDGASGTITGVVVPRLSGTYLGQLCQPLGSSCLGAQDVATATLSQKGTTLTISLALTGADNSTLTLSGPVAGNFFSVQGTFQGQPVAYYGYYQTFLETDNNGVVNDIQNLYLANTASPAQLAGLLTVPLSP